jgi:hypothetical protein
VQKSRKKGDSQTIPEGLIREIFVVFGQSSKSLIVIHFPADPHPVAIAARFEIYLVTHVDLDFDTLETFDEVQCPISCLLMKALIIPIVAATKTLLVFAK